jgi:cell pole-organizing protein PopZ
MRTNKDKDLSMEDVLSSIRKYVTESNEKRPMIYSNSDSDLDVIRLEEPYEEPDYSEYKEANEYFGMDEQYKDTNETNYNENYNEEHIDHNANNNFDSRDYDMDNSKNYVKHKDRLLEEKSEQEVSSSFKSLKSHLEEEKQKGSSIESFFESIASPMVAKWLNENLEAIVRELVSKEIERITKECK